MVGVEPLSRRTALSVPAAVAAASVAGCGSTAGPGSPSTASRDPDEQVLRRAVAREERLRAELRAASRRHRRLGRALAAVDNVHGEHVVFLVRSLDPAPPSADTDVPAPDQADPADPADDADAVRGLARSERALARAHAAAALEARSGPFARVLAGIAAAAEQQAHVLDALAGAGRRRG